MESYGFRYDDTLTRQVRNLAQEARAQMSAFGMTHRATFIAQSVKVFLNPLATSPRQKHQIQFRAALGSTRSGMEPSCWCNLLLVAHLLLRATFETVF